MACFELAGLLTFAGCGDGSPSKHDAAASTDVKKDLGSGGQDGGVADTASDKGTSQGEVSSVSPDGSGTLADLSYPKDGPNSDVTHGDTPSTDDTNTGAIDDAAPSEDVPLLVDDAHPSNDTPVSESGGAAGQTGTGGGGGAGGAGGTVGAIDGSAIDGSNTDTPISPAVITGWPTAGFNFGLNPCGGPAPAVQTFQLTNTGSSVAHITSAQFTGTAGYTTDAEGKAIAAGDTLTVTIHAPGIPQVAAVGESYDDSLTIQTDVPNDDQHLVAVTESAQGVVLAWNNADTFGPFASLAPGQTTSASFHVVNTGNLSADITLVATNAFHVSSGSPVTVAPTHSADGTVVFTAPNAAGPASGTLSVGLATPVALCQPLPSPLSLTGSSINGGIALSAVSLSFATNCGGTPTGQDVTIANTGTAAMTWTAALDGGNSSIFHLSSSTATLATPVSGSPNPSSQVTVTPNSPSSATPVTDVINITTDIIGDEVHHITLTQTPLGDAISVLGSTSLDFGSVPIAATAQRSAPIVLTIKNDANPNSEPAAVTLSMIGPGAQYFAVDPASVSIPAGQQADVSVTFAPGTSAAIVTGGANHVDLAASLHWQVGSEVNCGTPSGNIPATGTATLALVSGIPGALNFGLVNCGSAAAAQQITVTNPGSASFQITSVTSANPTHYVLDYATLPITVAAQGSAVITVTPNGIPTVVAAVPDHASYDGSLVITTDAINDTPHSVDLTMGAQGVIITNDLWPTDWTFGTANVGATRKLNISIVNAGNVSAQAALVDTIFAGDQVFSLVPSQTIDPGTSNLVARFQPTALDLTYTASARLVITPATNQVFCAALPVGWNSSTRNIHMQGMSASSP
jgi:hypothetical protein